MIPNNEMNLTDRDVATILAKKIFYTNTKKEDFALQLFIEQLVLPEDCNSYGLDELTEYIMDFMGEH
jgi:hypothetical protein